MADKDKTASFKNQDKLNAFMRAGRMRAPNGAIHGATHTSLKDVFKLKTEDGRYLTAAEIEAEGGSVAATGTSIFDPVLTELAYRWFCPPGGQILDPFAGGSVRGIVARMLGRRYTGIDLSANQLRANRIQAEAICPVDPPIWIHGNSVEIETLAAGVQADFIMACPPYFDLEVYSSDEGDLSNMTYDQFLVAYRAIIAACVRMLKPDRFACFVVGDMRDKAGMLRGFPWHTVQAFQDAGAHLYNSSVLVTAVGSLPVRAGRQFAAGRKLGRTHQDVFIFLKGDAKRACAACGEL